MIARRDRGNDRYDRRHDGRPGHGKYNKKPSRKNSGYKNHGPKKPGYKSHGSKKIGNKKNHRNDRNDRHDGYDLRGRRNHR
jgi:hypothetical protein